MTISEYISTSEEATLKLGRGLGQVIQQPLLIFLTGTLGAGKTRFVKAVASGLEIEPETVQSPTFTIMTPHAGRMPLVHVDAYRIEDIDEAQQLGLDDWIESGCVMLVEWSERIENALPKPDIRVSIEHIDQSTRAFRMEAHSSAGDQLLIDFNERHGSSSGSANERSAFRNRD